jgi:acetoin utilization protein AcuB
VYRAAAQVRLRPRRRRDVLAGARQALAFLRDEEPHLPEVSMQAQPTVGEIMTRDVVTLFEEDNLARVRSELAHYRFHHLPVVDDGKLVGMLSQRDLLHAVASLEATPSPIELAREARLLEQTFVRNIMQTDVVTVRVDDSLRDATRRMLERGIGALPVVDREDKLVGIVTEHDLLRTIAET